MKELFRVLKDHKNQMIQELVNASYGHCFRNEMDSLLGEEDFMDTQDCGTEKVARVWLTNSCFGSTLKRSITKLQDAKLQIDMFGFHADNPQSGDEETRLSDKLTVLVNDIGLAMKKMEYALFRGKMYKKVPSAKYTFAYKCEVRVFINSLAANEFFKARLLKDMRKIIDILSDPDCEVIRPISIDYNLIEVDGGHCWSIKERRFVNNPIADEKMGVISPRAFTRYDPDKEPDPKYFKEILENSLSQAEIREFCEDFLKLLNFNKKCHKDKVPCLIGDANSGKTSLFHPILGIVHHTNIATITKQRVFNKAMISKSTEVIFIDEASTSTMDIDDWKILTQGGYTACDVKYQTAKSFINRCPMLLTAQTKLQFKPEDQPAMDRRLRNYSFKSLPAPKKSATAWLRRHPMECIVWAAAQARACMTSDSEDELSDEESADDGVLAATDKEQIRALCMDEVLDERDGSPVGVSVQGATDETEDDSDASSQNDQTISALRRVMEQCSQTSLRHRQVSAMLQARLSERDRQRQAEEAVYRRRQENLLSKGVAREHVALLPRDTSEPMPTQIENDLTAFRQQTLQEDLKRKRERALAAFQTPWLLEMEQELHKLTRTLEMSDMNQERRTSMEAYREVLQDKLRQFHENYGTAGCHFALEQRKRSCVTLGLLKKEQRFLVTSLFQVLPTEDESGESFRSDGHRDGSTTHKESLDAAPSITDTLAVTSVQGTTSENEISSDEDVFITPLPRSQTSSTAPPRCHRRATTTDSRKRRGASSSQQSKRIKTFRQTNKIDNYFSSQN